MTQLKRFLFADADQDAPVQLSVDAAEVWLYSARSPEKAPPNEDAGAAWQLADARIVLAVADGLGGAPAGAKAAALAIGELDRSLAAAADGALVRTAILDAFEHSNQQILDLGLGAGTTLVVAEISAEGLRTYHVGDSSAVVVGQRGKLKLETISHSPVGYGIAAGLIDPDAALEHDDRHYVTNHLGSSDMHIQLGSQLALADHDTLLLASDGLLDNLLPGEINEVIRAGPLSRAASRLASTTALRMRSTAGEGPSKPDDVTFILHRGRSVQ